MNYESDKAGEDMPDKIKTIKNERDHQRMLKELEALMDAEANTPEGARLNELATLIDEWEEKHCPIEAPVGE